MYIWFLVSELVKIAGGVLMAYGAVNFFSGDFPNMVFGFAGVAVGLIVFGIGVGACEIIEPKLDALERAKQPKVTSPERAAKREKVIERILVGLLVALVLAILFAPIDKWLDLVPPEVMIGVVGGFLYLIFMLACAFLAAGVMRKMGIK